MTVAENLPLTSSHWGTYRARVSNGRVQELLPFEHDLDPSPIGPGIIDVQHGPTRIDAPMVRKSWGRILLGCKLNFIQAHVTKSHKKAIK